MSSATLIKMPQRFDYKASAAFNASLAAAINDLDGADKKVVIDCAQMEYIDSAGIGILIMAHKKSQNANARLSMINITSAAKEIIIFANLQKLIDIH